MTFCRHIARTVLLASLLLSPAAAEVTLPAVLTDHMVLQRDLPIHIWGQAAPGEAVTVSFRGNSRSAATDRDGQWSVSLPPSAPGGPFELEVRGANAVTLRDILVGDVWVASGQSNMQFQVKNVINAGAELASANRPRIRLFQVERKVSAFPLPNVEAKPWTPCTPASVADFSAVAYFFGRNLQEKLDIPIGLIDSSWGGTPAESWTSLRGLSSEASLMPVFGSWSRRTEGEALGRPRREKELAEWRQAVDRAKAQGTTPPGFPWRGNDSGEWAPAGLFNAMIAPLTRFPVRGAIWYQGESNASRDGAALYARLFRTMIQDWRRAWGVGNFPFLFVQLANYKTDPNSAWPELREAQTQTLSLTNTGMAVIIDIGDPADVHPRNKQDVGARLALAARAISFGEKIEYSGPIFRQVTPEDGALRVWFDHAAGLTAKGAVKGFEVAPVEGGYVPAQARIDGSTVVVSSPSVAAPVRVRYGWQDNPDCNLYNGAELPASPFRSAE